MSGSRSFESNAHTLGSDAPLYHRPYRHGRVDRAVRRCRSSRSRPADHEDGCSSSATACTRVQWVTNLFMHAGWALHRQHGLPLGLRDHRRREAGLVGVHAGVPGHRRGGKCRDSASFASREPVTCSAHRVPSTACLPCAWSGRPGTRFTASRFFGSFPIGFRSFDSVVRRVLHRHGVPRIRVERLFDLGRDGPPRRRGSRARRWRSRFSSSTWSIARTGTSSP